MTLHQQRALEADDRAPWVPVTAQEPVSSR